MRRTSSDFDGLAWFARLCVGPIVLCCIGSFGLRANDGVLKDCCIYFAAVNSRLGLAYFVYRAYVVMFTVLNYFILHTTSRLGAFSMNHLHVTENVDEKYVYVVMRKIVVVSGSRRL